MAVYEHHYKPYEGRLTPAWARFLVLPRYAYQDLLKYKFFIGFLVACFVGPLISAIIIYLHHNLSLLSGWQINPRDLITINGDFFGVMTYVQALLAFVFTVVIGPVLISRDLANNALPLYLCRPFTRAEYILGKMSVLLLLLSAVTWVPQLLLFFFQAYLEGGSWLAENWWIGQAIFLGCLTYIVILSSLAMAFSAWIKWRTAASAALFAIFIIPWPIGFAIQGLFGTTSGHLINLGAALGVMYVDLFRIDGAEDVPFSVGEAWVVYFVYAALCLYMLWRKVRAYEVVS